MRIPGLRRRQERGDEAFEQQPSQIICPVCGLRNDGLARFCRNCGLPLGAPRDPVRGTTSRRADLPSEHGAGIAAIVGLLAAVVVLAGAGFLIFRSSSGGGTAVATPTPAGSAAPVASQPAPTDGALPSRIPGGSVDPGASGAPVASGDPTLPRRTAEPSGAPSQAPTSPTPLVADTGFTCEPADFNDPTRGVWRITQARWGARDGGFDELTIVLVREEGRGRTNLAVEAMTAREAAQISGLEPAANRRVILLTMDGPITLRREIFADISGLRALDSLNIQTIGDTTYAVVGVNGDGCFKMVVPAWKRGQTAAVGDEVNLLLDVRYR